MVTWVGASTAVFAALIAVAQNDIKRILAYSTVSQLGYMMAGLGMGGVAVGMFHLITHAFFKALLFMGAGSVIHGCHEEQDIRHMGGLRKYMPVTFATYAVGMLALTGFPLVFSGFWSKDAILESAQHWKAGQGPFFMLVFGALLTAFYMTRQVSYVFFGEYRGHGHAHESPRVMTMPLAILAFFAIALGVLGTPAWPWFRSFLTDRPATFGIGLVSTSRDWSVADADLDVVVVSIGYGLGWALYGNKSPQAERAGCAGEGDAAGVDCAAAIAFTSTSSTARPVIAFYCWWARVADWLDRRVWGGAVAAVTWLFGLWARFNRFLDAELRERRLRQGLRRTFYWRRSAGARAIGPRANLSAAAGPRGSGTGRNLDLEQPRMNGISDTDTR